MQTFWAHEKLKGVTLKSQQCHHQRTLGMTINMQNVTKKFQAVAEKIRK